MHSGPPSSKACSINSVGDRGFFALLRGIPLQQSPGDDDRSLGRDTDQADQAKILAQPAAIDRIDFAPDQLALEQRTDGRLLDSVPSPGLDATKGIAERVGMARQGFRLFALGMAIPVIVAGLDLGRGPTHWKQDGWFLKQKSGRGIQRGFTEKRKSG